MMFPESGGMNDGLFSSVYCVDSGPSTGRYNMEYDIRLMQAMVDGSFQKNFGHDSCLWRFYAWEPAAVSLGYNQDPDDIDARRCRDDGVDIVVRPTGGRAVFHADELTYSFFAHTSAGNAEIYRMVHEVIGRVLEQVGVFPDFCRSQPDFRKRYASAEAIPCFTASARYELQVDGRKIVGSAQRRRENVILQHGSLPLSGRHKEIIRYIHTDDAELLAGIADDMDRKTVSLHELAGTSAVYGDLVPLLVAEAGRYFGVEATVLQPHELDRLFGCQELQNS